MGVFPNVKDCGDLEATSAVEGNRAVSFRTASGSSFSDFALFTVLTVGVFVFVDVAE